MIYDCFTFFCENDLLDIRINELSLCDDSVTHILVEANTTFTGKPKPFLFDAHRFCKHTNIFRLQIDDMPLGTAWDREKHQRNAIKKALNFLTPSLTDKVIISDVDEIPRAKQIDKFKPNIEFAALDMDKYSYYLNCLEGRQTWDRARVMSWHYLKDKSVDDVRNSGYDFSIHDAGWHWSWCIDPIQKLHSFSHQELNTPENEIRIKEGKNIEDEKELEIVEIDLSYPEYLVKNIDKFSHLIK